VAKAIEVEPIANAQHKPITNFFMCNLPFSIFGTQSVMRENPLSLRF